MVYGCYSEFVNICVRHRVTGDVFMTQQLVVPTTNYCKTRSIAYNKS